MTKFLNCLYLFTLIGILSSCQQEAQTSQENAPHSVQESHTTFTPSQVKYAKGFSLEYKGPVKVLHLLNPFIETGDTSTFILGEDQNLVPSEYQDKPFIKVPLNKIAVLSTTHISMFEALGITEKIVGVSGTQYVYNEKVKKRIQEGEVFDVGYISNLNYELLIGTQSELLLSSGSTAKSFSGDAKLERAGIHLLPNTDWQETHPLGKAEWIKVVAALTNQEEKANTYFENISNEYEQLVALAQNATNTPSIFFNLSYKGTWFMPAGNSYMAQLLQDANLQYPWAQVKGKGSLSLTFENVYHKALESDLWINTGQANSLADIEGIDERYKDFKPFKNQQIFNCNNRMKGDANDFWESASTHPHLVLADIIKIGHPELLPAHELYYYQNLK